MKYVKKNKVHFVVKKFFFPKNLAFYEMMWGNIAQPAWPQLSI